MGGISSPSPPVARKGGVNDDPALLLSLARCSSAWYADHVFILSYFPVFAILSGGDLEPLSGSLVVVVVILSLAKNVLDEVIFILRNECPFRKSICLIALLLSLAALFGVAFLFFSQSVSHNPGGR